MHWETERQFLEFGLDESDPVDLAGQHSQSVDLGIPTQNGELPNFETIDPAILNGHASPVVEQAQRTMSIAGITTHPEECPAESIRSQHKVSPLQRRRDSKGMMDTDCQTSKIKKGSVRAQFSALSVEDQLQFLSWLFEAPLVLLHQANVTK
ncbi:unnamed protein product [Penicillium palitans]